MGRHLSQSSLSKQKIVVVRVKAQPKSAVPCLLSLI